MILCDKDERLLGLNKPKKKKQKTGHECGYLFYVLVSRVEMIVAEVLARLEGSLMAVFCDSQQMRVESKARSRVEKKL